MLENTYYIIMLETSGLCIACSYTRTKKLQAKIVLDLIINNDIYRDDIF
jgi:hypothetical protein